MTTNQSGLRAEIPTSASGPVPMPSEFTFLPNAEVAQSAAPASSANSAKAANELRRLAAQYQHPDRKRSIIQLLTSFVPFVGLWVLMYYSLSVSYWLTLGLATITAGFLIRIFIIFHDCGHGSFFRSKRASHFWGVVAGLITFTPYYSWLARHARHHATSGDLDNRGYGDVWTMTVKEFRAASPSQRLKYRLYRNPFILLIFGPLYIVLITNRFVRQADKGRERLSIIWTNVGVVTMVLGLGYLMGFTNYMLIQIPVILIGTSAGVWMFYVQHQYEGVAWDRHDEWDFVNASIEGSSHYDLPKLFHWFTGNIGFHHIHHLNPRIPNYKLEECHKNNPPLRPANPLSFRASLKSLGYRLWDEEAQKMVGFGVLRTQR